LVRAFFQGALAGIFAVGALAGLLFLMYHSDVEIFRELQMVFNLWKVGLAGLIIIFFGILLCVSITFFSVSKYLKMKLDDLY